MRPIAARTEELSSTGRGTRRGVERGSVYSSSSPDRCSIMPCPRPVGSLTVSPSRSDSKSKVTGRARTGWAGSGIRWRAIRAVAALPASRSHRDTSGLSRVGARRGGDARDPLPLSTSGAGKCSRTCRTYCAWRRTPGPCRADQQPQSWSEGGGQVSVDTVQLLQCLFPARMPDRIGLSIPISPRRFAPVAPAHPGATERGGGEASPTQLARLLDAPVANVAYHVRVLEKLDCVELVRTRQVRGALEHHYRAIAHPWLDAEQWARLPASFRRQALARTLRDIVSEASDAGVAGGFDHPGAQVRRVDRGPRPARLAGRCGAARGHACVGATDPRRQLPSALPRARLAGRPSKLRSACCSSVALRNPPDRGRSANVVQPSRSTRRCSNSLIDDDVLRMLVPRISPRSGRRRDGQPRWSGGACIRRPGGGQSWRRSTSKSLVVGAQHDKKQTRASHTGWAGRGCSSRRPARPRRHFRHAPPNPLRTSRPSTERRPQRSPDDARGQFHAATAPGR